MAYEYEVERGAGGGTFLLGVLAGTVIGAGLGMLFAPKSGSELRSDLSNRIADQTGRVRDAANQTYAKARDAADQTYTKATDRVSQMVDRGREAYDRARTNVGTTIAATGAAVAND